MVYGQNEMSEDNGVECSKMGGWTNVHNEEQSGQPAICSE
jgi:hypothetical protein